MNVVHHTQHTDTPFQDIHRLQVLYNAGFHDDFLDRALRKIIEQQIHQDHAHLEQITHDLRAFEAHYALSSDEFMSRYHAGMMADTIDFMEWNVFCKMRHRILERLSILL